MKVRQFKKGLAQLLIVTTLATTTGITSFAQMTAPGDLRGTKGVDYKLVTLHLDEGSRFMEPLRFVEGSVPTATGSNTPTATDSNAPTASDSDAPTASDSNTGETDGELKVTGRLEKYGEPGQVTTFARVEADGDFVGEVTKQEIEEATSAANLNAPGPGYRYEWLTEKGNLDSVIGNIHDLTAAETHLYGVAYSEADVDSEQLESSTVEAVNLPEQTVLKVTDLETKKTAEELKTEAVKNGYSAIDFESALQLEMNLIDTYDQTNKDYQGEVTIETELPDSFLDVAGNRDIVVIHFGRETEVITAEKLLYKDEWSGQSWWDGRIRFKLNGLSPVIIAIGDKPVKVLLEKGEAGIGVVYEEIEGFNDDGDQVIEKRTYLPTGQEVDVPKGTRLTLRYPEIYYDQEADYDIKGYEIIEDGGAPQPYEYWEDYSIAANEKVVIRPVYEKVEEDEGEKRDRIIIHKDNNGNWPNPAQVSGTLELQRYNVDGGRYEAITGTNWKIEAWSSGDQEIHDKFEIIENDQVVLRSKTELPYGRYDIRVVCLSPENKKINRIFSFIVGVRTYAAVYLGEWQDENGRETEWLADPYGEDIHAPGKTLADSLATMKEEEPYSVAKEIAMFGYTHYGWYENSNIRKEVGLDKAINENTSVYARFYNLDANGNKVWYEAKSTTSGGDTPVNPGGSHGGSGGGGGGGGGSRSSAGGDTMSGSWQRDERGWRFQMAGGSYATNTWGRINGSWYYFGADTYMMTGWIYVSEQWYYLNQEQGDNEGKMKTGWVFDNTYGKWFYMNTSGAMQSGWQKINHVWYYLNPVADGTRGAMFADQWIDNYYVDANGAWVESMTR